MEEIMVTQFQKATKKQSHLRMAIDGSSGAGKTYTALVAATEIAKSRKGRIAVIDTERGSASLYSDIFDFDVLELTDFSPRNYVEAIHAAEGAGYPVIVIDSLSHAWEGEGG
jgi:KaiC/GvpD/RAD55 family RecA-like ATPase